MSDHDRGQRRSLTESEREAQREETRFRSELEHDQRIFEARHERWTLWEDCVRELGAEHARERFLVLAHERGRDVGIAMGEDIGRSMGRTLVARAMLREGLDRTLVAEALDVPVGMIDRIVTGRVELARMMIGWGARRNDIAEALGVAVDELAEWVGEV